MTEAPKIQQRSNAWRKLRIGSVTASRFKDVLTQPKSKSSKESGEWSETARTYMIELLAELVTCRPLDRFSTAATKWGTEWEAEAFKRAIPVVRSRFGSDLIVPEGEFAYIEHCDHPGIGCSPDGVISTDAMLEIKCPASSAVHMRTVLNGEMPEGHLAQVQGGLWVTGRKRYLFCSFDPRVEASGLDPLFTCVVERDDEYINNTLAPAVIRFKTWLMNEYRKLVPNKAPF